MQPTKRLPAVYRLRIKGLHTHKRILDCAIDIAAHLGLEALTFGQLAAELSMSKSGIFTHFGSKEALQVEILESVWESFENQIDLGYLEAPDGVPRLLAICMAWLTYAFSRTNGGFLLAASMEYDDRPGNIHDLVEHYVRKWTTVLVGEALAGMKLGHFKEGTEVDVLVFHIQGLGNQRLLDRHLPRPRRGTAHEPAVSGAGGAVQRRRRGDHHSHR